MTKPSLERTGIAGRPAVAWQYQINYGPQQTTVEVTR
jgi:hypothetical protein